MDVFTVSGDQHFVWDSNKAAENAKKHGVTFMQGIEAIRDPLAVFEDASLSGEARQAILGEDRGRRVLYVVHVVFDDEVWRLISARPATRGEIRRYEDAQ